MESSRGSAPNRPKAPPVRDRLAAGLLSLRLPADDPIRSGTEAMDEATESGCVEFSRSPIHIQLQVYFKPRVPTGRRLS